MILVPITHIDRFKRNVIKCDFVSSAEVTVQTHALLRESMLTDGKSEKDKKVG